MLELAALIFALGTAQAPEAASVEPAATDDCQACHLQHRESLPATHAGLMPAFGSCQSCHELGPDGQPALHEYRHLPFEDGECEICHEPADEGQKAVPPDPDPEVCLACHSDLESAMEAPQGHPALRLEGGCENCHSPHATPYEHQLWKPAEELCLSCHASIRWQGASRSVKHKPAFGGSCTICHNPHASQHSQLLRRDINALCLECHSKMIAVDTPSLELFDGTVSLPMSFFNDMTVIMVEPGATKGHPFMNHPFAGKTKAGEILNCITCHSPHAGDAPKLLVMSAGEPQSNMCLRCHQGEKK